jgi:hypothetical protein
MPCRTRSAAPMGKAPAVPRIGRQPAAINALAERLGLNRRTSPGGVKRHLSTAAGRPRATLAYPPVNVPVNVNVRVSADISVVKVPSPV